MNKYYRLLLAVFLVIPAPSVFAETLNYTYVSASYSRLSAKIDGVSEKLDASGYEVDFSIAVRPYIIVLGGYSRSNAGVSAAGSRLDADIDAVSLGFLIRAEINDVSDFILGAAFINGNADVRIDGGSTTSVDADGGVTFIGFRSMISESFEVNGFVRKYAIEDASTISVSFGGGYYVTKSVSLDLAYQFDIDKGSDLLTFGVTKYF